MQSLRKALILGALFWSATSTVALAQGQAASVMLVCSEKEPNPCSTYITGLHQGLKDSTRYVSIVHSAALRGITFPDSATLKQFQQALFRQVDEVWHEAKQYVTETGADKEANQTLQKDMFASLLPELRALIPTDQQATFDQNVKSFRESGKPITIIPADGFQELISTSYAHVVDSVALRGITFTDRAAQAQLWKTLERQGKEVGRKSGKKSVGRGPTATFDAWAAAERRENAEMRRKQKELVDTRLPELRPLIPTDQRTTFDQNLKALRESDYEIMLDLRNSPHRQKDEVPALYLIGCMTLKHC